MEKKVKRISAPRETGVQRHARMRIKNHGLDDGLFTIRDSNDFIKSVAYPALLRTLGAHASIRTQYGDLYRSASIGTGETDQKQYYVSTEHAKGEPVSFEVSVTDVHFLDDDELMVEWPIIETTDLATELMIESASRNDPEFGEDDDFDLDNEKTRLRLASGELETLAEAAVEGVDEDFGSLLYGDNVLRYAQKVLKLTADKRPQLQYMVGYGFEDEAYPVDIAIVPCDRLLGDTPAELQILGQLADESEHVVDDQLLKEFREALEVLDILKKTRRRTK